MVKIDKLWAGLKFQIKNGTVYEVLKIRDDQHCDVICIDTGFKYSYHRNQPLLDNINKGELTIVNHTKIYELW